MLFSLIFTLVAMLLDKIVFGKAQSVFYALMGLFLFLPSLAVQVRRLRDTNRSGKRLLWMMLAYVVWVVLLMITGFSALFSSSVTSASLTFLIIAGVGCLFFLVWGIFFLVWYCTAGTPGENQYGPDPMASEEQTVI